MNESLTSEIHNTFKNTKCSIIGNNRLSIKTNNEVIAPLLKFLKDKKFNRLAMVSCVDWIKRETFEIIYIVASFCIENPLNIIIKTEISRQKPEINTIIDIFENAEPYEREIHELFGVNVIGHPRLIPLLLEREYKIPPLRKDFDMRKYSKELFDSIPFIGDKK
jgi:NADH-quinone oxidoreductase subunit C